MKKILVFTPFLFVFYCSSMELAKKNSSMVLERKDSIEGRYNVTNPSEKEMIRESKELRRVNSFVASVKKENDTLYFSRILDFLIGTAKGKAQDNINLEEFQLLEQADRNDLKFGITTYSDLIQTPQKITTEAILKITNFKNVAHKSNFIDEDFKFQTLHSTIKVLDENNNEVSLTQAMENYETAQAKKSSSLKKYLYSSAICVSALVGLAYYAYSTANSAWSFFEVLAQPSQPWQWW